MAVNAKRARRRQALLSLAALRSAALARMIHDIVDLRTRDPDIPELPVIEAEQHLSGSLALLMRDPGCQPIVDKIADSGRELAACRDGCGVGDAAQHGHGDV